MTLLLVGCTAPPPDPSQYVGDTLDVALQHLRAPNVIDLSSNVVMQPPAYSGASEGSAWVVVAGCYRDDQKAVPKQDIGIGVIPAADMTGQIRTKAKKGAYNKFVYTCPSFNP